MRIIAKLLLTLSVVAVASTSVFSAEAVNKRLTVSGVPNSGDTVIAVDYNLSKADTVIGGTEANFSYANGSLVNSDSDTNKVSVGLGYYAGKSSLRVSGGGTLNYIDTNDTIRAGVYAGATLDISENWFVSAKYNHVFDESFANGWQFGLGYSW